MTHIERWMRKFREAEDRFLKDSVLTVLFRFARLPVAFLISVVLARELGPTGRGIYGLVALIFQILLIVGALGIHNSHVYFVGKRRFGMGEIAGGALLTTVVLSVLAVSAFGGFYVLWPDVILDGEHTLIIFATLAFLPFGVLRLHFRYGFLAYEEIFAFNLTDFAERVLLLCGVVLLLTVLGGGVEQALGAFVASLILICAVSGLWFAGRRELRFRDLRVSGEHLKNAFDFGAKTGVAGLVQTLNLRFDFFLVAYFLTEADLGIYAVAAGLGGVALQVPIGISSVVFPKIAGSTVESADRITSKVCRAVLLIACIQGLAFVALGYPLIRYLYGSEFLNAYPALLLLTPGIIGMAVARIVMGDLSGRGRPGVLTCSTIISLTIAIGLDVLLIPRWGISGAAVGSTVGYLAGAAVPVYVMVKETSVTVQELLLPGPADVREYWMRGRKLWMSFNG